jgi:hypothetical protein
MAVGHIKLESPENTEEMAKEKLQRVNEPGEVVKCLFDPMTMDDIADNFPENVRNVGHKPITQTDVSTRVGKCSYISCSYMFLYYIRIFFWEAKMFLYFLILCHYLFYFEVVNLNYLTFILKIRYTDNSRTAVITIFIILKAKTLQQHLKLKLNRHFRILDDVII